MMRTEWLTTLHIHEERGRNIIVDGRTEYGRRCEGGSRWEDGGEKGCLAGATHEREGYVLPQVGSPR